MFLVYGERMRIREDKEKVSFTFVFCVFFYLKVDLFLRERRGIFINNIKFSKVVGNLEVNGRD